MIKIVPVYYKQFEQIQRGRNDLNIYVSNDNPKEFKKGDILRIIECEPLKRGQRETGNFIHVEVTDLTDVVYDKDRSRIYKMYIKPRLDYTICLHSIKNKGV